MSFNHSPQPLLGSAEIEHSEDSQNHGGNSQLGPKHGRPEDNTEVHTMVEITADDDLELARPPYLQVRSNEIFDCDAPTDDEIGYACWRYRRYDR